MHKIWLLGIAGLVFCVAGTWLIQSQPSKLGEFDDDLINNIKPFRVDPPSGQLGTSECQPDGMLVFSSPSLTWSLGKISKVIMISTPTTTATKSLGIQIIGGVYPISLKYEVILGDTPSPFLESILSATPSTVPWIDSQIERGDISGAFRILRWTPIHPLAATADQWTRLTQRCPYIPSV